MILSLLWSGNNILCIRNDGEGRSHFNPLLQFLYYISLSQATQNLCREKVFQTAVIHKSLKKYILNIDGLVITLEVYMVLS